MDSEVIVISDEEVMISDDEHYEQDDKKDEHEPNPCADVNENSESNDIISLSDDDETLANNLSEYSPVDLSQNSDNISLISDCIQLDESESSSEEECNYKALKRKHCQHSSKTRQTGNKKIKPDTTTIRDLIIKCKKRISTDCSEDESSSNNTSMSEEDQRSGDASIKSSEEIYSDIDAEILESEKDDDESNLSIDDSYIILEKEISFIDDTKNENKTSANGDEMKKENDFTSKGIDSDINSVELNKSRKEKCSTNVGGHSCQEYNSDDSENLDDFIENEMSELGDITDTNDAQENDNVEAIESNEDTMSEAEILESEKDDDESNLPLYDSDNDESILSTDHSDNDESNLLIDETKNENKTTANGDETKKEIDSDINSVELNKNKDDDESNISIDNSSMILEKEISFIDETKNENKTSTNGDEMKKENYFISNIQINSANKEVS